MSEKLHEQISAFVDNEVNDPELLIRQICKDSELQERWYRYHLMHDVMTNQASAPKIDLSKRISDALEDEPEIHTIIPKKSKPSRVGYIMKQAAGLGIAATVSALAVITVQQQSTDSPLAVQEVAANTSKVPVTQAQVRFVNESSQMDNKVQSKLSNYLVNHNEYSITSNMQGVLPYTRVVTTPGQRVVVRSINDK